MLNMIDVNNLTFKYNEKPILKNVSFSVNKGDFIGILGANGSGKSTLIKLILGLLVPSCGQIKIMGEDIGKFSNWSKVGYISQKANSFNSAFPATVEEIVGANLFSKIGLFRFPNKGHKEMVYNALELVDMQDYGKQLIGNLSGGQQQRVFIARVLVSEPEIMLLDEPTVGIDLKSEEAVYCLLARLNRELGLTIVMVTHDISAVTVHANKIACLGSNGIIIHDPEKELTQEFITELYGYGVNLHIHRHDCINCSGRECK